MSNRIITDATVLPARRAGLSRSRLLLALLIAIGLPGGVTWTGSHGIDVALPVPAHARAAGLVRIRYTAPRPRMPAAEVGPDHWHRVADAPQSAALFAAHSWYVAPPPPAPPPPPPPPVPTAPPFPFTYVGSFTSQGGKTVYFLGHGDTVIDAHVGDRLDGVYDFETDAGGQLQFNYLPLKIRQTLSASTSP